MMSEVKTSGSFVRYGEGGDELIAGPDDRT